MIDSNDESPPRFRLDVATGTLSDGPIRYVMIRADGLMGAFVGADSRAALSSLCESVYRHGRKSLIQYQSRHGSDPGVLMATAAQVAANLGWGAWEFARPSPHELRVTIQNSPFAGAVAPSEYPVCAPILGMVRAVGELVLGGAVLAREFECAACGARICGFSAHLAPGP